MVPRVDFDIADLVLKVLEGLEVGNRGLYRKYRPYKNHENFKILFLVPGVQKNDFYDFSGFFYEKIPEYGNLE